MRQFLLVRYSFCILKVALQVHSVYFWTVISLRNARQLWNSIVLALTSSCKAFRICPVVYEWFLMFSFGMWFIPIEICEQAYKRTDRTGIDRNDDRTVDLYLKLGPLSRWRVPLVTIIVVLWRQFYLICHFKYPKSEEWFLNHSR